jgi:hypothetical protein
MRRIALLLTVVSLICLFPALMASSSVIKERRDVPVPNPKAVFLQACKYLNDDLAPGKDFSKSKYYIHTVTYEGNELTDDPMTLAMIEDPTSPGSYYSVLFFGKEPVFGVNDMYEPPFDDYFGRIINMYATAMIRVYEDDEDFEDGEEDANRPFTDGANDTENLAKESLKPKGFRGINWGQPISSLRDMKYLRDDEEAPGVMKYYIRENDKLMIGNAILETISYQFVNGKFSGVFITSKGIKNTSLLTETLKKALGEPSQEGTQGGFALFSYKKWFFSDVSVGQLFDRETSIIIYTYLPLYNDTDRLLQESNNMGVNDL